MLYETAIPQRKQAPVRVVRLCIITAVAVDQRQRLYSGVRVLLPGFISVPQMHLVDTKGRNGIYVTGVPRVTTIVRLFRPIIPRNIKFDREVRGHGGQTGGVAPTRYLFKDSASCAPSLRLPSFFCPRFVEPFLPHCRALRDQALPRVLPSGSTNMGHACFGSYTCLVKSRCKRLAFSRRVFAFDLSSFDASF